MSVPTEAKAVGALPWSVEDLLRWLGGTSFGVVLIIGGWWSAAGQGSLESQVAPAALAVSGAIVAGVAHVLWILKGRRAVGQRLTSLSSGDWLPTETMARHSPPGDDGGRLIVIGPRSKLYHLASCAMVRDRSWRTVPYGEQATGGRRACGICRP